MDGVRLEDMTLPELLELIRSAVEEVEIRAMQEAGGGENGRQQ